MKKLDDLRSPLRYLLGKTKLEKELSWLSLAAEVSPETPGNMVLRGVPKGMEDRVSSVLLEVTPEGEIARMVINEVDGSSTEYRFGNQRQNQPIADQRFRFSPPRRVEVIERGRHLSAVRREAESGEHGDPNPAAPTRARNCLGFLPK